MKPHKSKRRPSDYDATRKNILLEDNMAEDKLIKQLSKRLKLKRRIKASGSSSESHPRWLKQCGFDYLLDFDVDVESSEIKEDKESKSAKVLGVKTKKSKLIKNLHGDIYGQTGYPSPNLTSSDNVVQGVKPGVEAAVIADAVVSDALPDDYRSLHRSVRSLLNRLSEAHMHSIVNGLAELFTTNPRAVVRDIIIGEVQNLLQSTLNHTHSSVGWLHQELAVCLTCIQSQLHNEPLISYLTECLVDELPSKSSTTCLKHLTSTSLFLAYLFRFGAISSKLLLDVIRELLEQPDLEVAKAVNSVCTAVGIYLRKSDLAACQQIVQSISQKLTTLDLNQFDLSCEFESVIRRLTEKHSKEECISRSVHLKKQMRLWTKDNLSSNDTFLSVGLSDLRNREVNGRWWLIGTASQSQSVPPIRSEADNTMTTVPPHLANETSSLSSDMEAAASSLGLKTPGRLQLFQILVSTSGGPDATAAALARACSTGGSTGNTREREMVQIVMHCLMAEDPFNRFYPRVLGGFLNMHRRFVMMVKCAFWDILKNEQLEMVAKANAGRALGILSLVYGLPLTVLKNFNFGDESSANTEFMRHVFIELCAGEHHQVLDKLKQLTCYTRLSRNCRIFMRKHFSMEENQVLRGSVFRLMEELRGLESL